RALLWLVPVASLPFVTACGDDDTGESNEGCSPADQSGCAAGLVCEEVQGGDPACFGPVSFKGKVYSALDKKPVGGARVVARDANDAAVSRVALTAAD